MKYLSPLALILLFIGSAAFAQEKPAELNLICVKVQGAVPVGQATVLECFANNVRAYHIIVVQEQGDAAGLVVAIGGAYVRITGPIAAHLIKNKRTPSEPSGEVFRLQGGISSTVYFGGGGDLAYYEDAAGTTLLVSGLGIGGGASAGGYAQKPVTLYIKKAFSNRFDTNTSRRLF